MRSLYDLILVKLPGYFFGLSFIGFAALQYNDPDPYIWVPIYLAAAYCSLAVAINRIKKIFLVPASFTFYFLMLFFIPSKWEGFGFEQFAMKSINQELARECSGLAICGTVMLFHFLVLRWRDYQSMGK